MVDALLLSLYVAYLVAHFIGVDSGMSRFFLWDGWYGDIDRSVLEFFGYAKMLVASGLAFVVFHRTRQRTYLAWSSVFLLIGLDDALMLHEATGYLLSDMTGAWIIFGLRARDVGQILFWLTVASLLGLWLLKTHISASPLARRDSIIFIACTGVIASFSIGLDFVHAVLDTLLPRVGNELLHFAEAAGEVAGMTLVLMACAVAFARRGVR